MSEQEEQLERLWSRVDPIPHAGCWIIDGWQDPSGYGRMRLKGKLYTTHRASWIIHNGPVPEGMHVLHKCDTPGCVNPNHLYLGTNTDNVRDRMIRGQRTGGAFIGERNQINRLTETQVREIRQKHSAGTKVCDLIREYGVSKGCVQGVCYRLNWKWLED